MSKNYCQRCGTKVQDNGYNPYNVTFHNYYFGRNERGGEGKFCLKCAEYFVRYHNKCKGGHWEIEKPTVKNMFEMFLKLGNNYD